MTGFAHVLDSADRLSLEEQEQLADTLRKRIAEKRRAEIVKTVKAARAEHATGKLKPASAAALFKKLSR